MYIFIRIKCSHNTTQKQSIQSIHTIVQTTNYKLQNKSTIDNQGKIKSDGKRQAQNL